MRTRIHYAFCIHVNSLRLFGARKGTVKPQQWCHERCSRGCRCTCSTTLLVVWIFVEFPFLFLHSIRPCEMTSTKNNQKPSTNFVASFSSFSISVHIGRPFRCSHIFFCFFVFVEWIENTKWQTKNTQNNCETFSWDRFAESKHVQLSVRCGIRLCRYFFFAIRCRQFATQPSAHTILVRRVGCCWKLLVSSSSIATLPSSIGCDRCISLHMHTNMFPGLLGAIFLRQRKGAKYVILFRQFVQK